MNSKMIRHSLRLLLAGAALAVTHSDALGATTRYVWTESPTPGGAFTSWATAAHDIQAAIDAAAEGDTILVTNGLYSSGYKVVNELLRNRVAIDKAVEVRSVNGPAGTIIEGAGPLGDMAVRCVYVTTGATLAGFTLRNGNTRTSGHPWWEQSGGGAFLEPDGTITNCVISRCTSFDLGGGVAGGAVYDCDLSENVSYGVGGGVGASVLARCNLLRNRSFLSGGGAYWSTLNWCLLQDNDAGDSGGGASESSLVDCTVAGNEADNGGGAANGSAERTSFANNRAYTGGGVSGMGSVSNSLIASCSAALGGGAASSQLLSGTVVSNNWAVEGGGAWDCASESVVFAENRARNGGGVSYGSHTDSLFRLNEASDGGGAFQATLTACRLEGNHAEDGGGALLSDLRECDLTGNSAGANGGGAYGGTVINCTLSSNYGSEGGGARFAYLEASDIFENSALFGGGLSDSTATNCTLRGNSTVGPGGGAIRCDLNDCQILDNWTGSEGGGASASTLAFCTLSNNQAEEGGGAEACTLAHCTITNNEAEEGGGVYGGVASNCTLSGNRAGSGGAAADATLIDCELFANVADNGNGGGMLRGRANGCLLAGNTAQSDGGGAREANLEDCMLENNSSGYHGGGASASRLLWCNLIGNRSEYGGGIAQSTASNCLIQANTAFNSGGGVEQSLSVSCLIVSNTADWGGGAVDAELLNCTLSGNVASGAGGGMLHCDVRNSILFGNSSPDHVNWSGGSMESCCTTPLPSGVGNIAQDPLFVDAPNSDYRLDPNSPCIDAGDTWPGIADATDRDGAPRLLGSEVDMGCYEQALNDDPRIGRSPILLEVYTTEGGTPLDELVAIWNRGTGTVSYVVTVDQGWMAVAPPANASSGGTNHHTLTFSANSLSVGEYWGTVTIESPEAVNSPQTITVRLEVMPDWNAVFNTSGLNWQSGGYLPWVQDLDTNHGDGRAGRNGDIWDTGNDAGYGTDSWMETSLVGPGTLSFWWRVDSEPDWDYFRFSIDGVEQTAISGLTDWAWLTFTLSEGPHVVRWTYTKDEVVSSGADSGWLDEVAWPDFLY